MGQEQQIPPGGNEPPSHGDTINVGNISDSHATAIGAGAMAINYQQLLRPLPINLSSLVRPLIEHYTAVFGGRDAELAALDAFLADPQRPFGLLVAPTGLGKTALLIHWIARIQQQHPHWWIIFAPISIRYQTASEEVTLSILAHSLAEIHDDLKQFRDYDRSPTSLRALISDYLRRPLPNQTNLLVVLDGIDESTGWAVGPLCAAPPQPGLKMVVAARQRANATYDDYQQQLAWEAATVTAVPLNRLDRPAIEALLRQHVPDHVANPAFVTEFFRVSEGDPLTSNLLIKALIGGSVTPASLTHRPPGLEAFLKEWVETLRKRQAENTLIEELLALCAAAYGPLSTVDLRALAPTVLTKRARILEAVHDDVIARFIITVGTADTSYVFSHQRLREVFLEEIFCDDERTELQQRLIAYGERWYADRSQSLPDYLRQFWIAHLKAAGQWPTIQRVLTEIVPSSDGQRFLQPWQIARYTIEGSDTGYLTDLESLWTWADQHQNLDLMFRCAVITASLRSRSGNLTPELLVQLVKVGTPEGRWSAAVALEQIAYMPDWQQATCIEALAEVGITLPWERTLEVSLAIEDESHHAEALIALAPHLPPAVLAEALRAARAITGEDTRAFALIALAPLLPTTDQPVVLAEALTSARAIVDANWRANTLSMLIAHLLLSDRPVVVAEALASARAIVDADARAIELSTLIAYLPSSDRPVVVAEALSAARAITSEDSRAFALRNLAPHLPPTDQPVVLAEALASARAIVDANWRANTLSMLVAHLPSSDRPVVVAEALASVRAINDANWNADTLGTLVPHLSPPDQLAILAEALSAARTITDAHRRVVALAALAPYLPPPEQPAVVAEALATTRTVTDAHTRAETLCAIAPKLPPSDQPDALAEALSAAHAITDAYTRAKTLHALAPKLSPSDQPDALAEALSAAHAITDAHTRAETLRALAPHLPPSEQPDVLAEALSAARAITNENRRAEALIALVPYLLPPDQAVILAEALLAASTMTDTHARARTLCDLAELLPPPNQPAVLAEALTAARAIFHDYMRARTLSELVPHLPSPDQPTVLTEALTAARAIFHDYMRARTLSELVPHLPSPDQLAIFAEVLAIVRAITNETWRASTLTDLSRHLPPELLIESLIAARAITHEDTCAEALRDLAPLLAKNHTLDTHFAPTLRMLARHGRPALLKDITALMPWITALAERKQQPTVLAALANTIIETARCWS